jgi:hypothetical protein
VAGIRLHAECRPLNWNVTGLQPVLTQLCSVLGRIVGRTIGGLRTLSFPDTGIRVLPGLTGLLARALTPPSVCMVRIESYLGSSEEFLSSLLHGIGVCCAACFPHLRGSAHEEARQPGIGAVRAAGRSTQSAAGFWIGGPDGRTAGC